MQGDAVLSEVRAAPGPTHGLFDLLAVCIFGLAPGGRRLALGFAAGGFVAPLRALGDTTPVEAVDHDPAGQRLFFDLCGTWAGEVSLHDADAIDWLRRSRRRYDLVVDDLSIATSSGVTKPAESLEVLPELIRKRLRPGGVAVVNLLPVSGWSWSALEGAAAPGHARALVIELNGYHNRIVVAGGVPGARTAGRLLRRGLRRIGSRIALDVAVRTLK